MQARLDNQHIATCSFPLLGTFGLLNLSPFIMPLPLSLIRSFIINLQHRNLFLSGSSFDSMMQMLRRHQTKNGMTSNAGTDVGSENLGHWEGRCSIGRQHAWHTVRVVAFWLLGGPRVKYMSEQKSDWIYCSNTLKRTTSMHTNQNCCSVIGCWAAA